MEDGLGSSKILIIIQKLRVVKLRERGLSEEIMTTFSPYKINRMKINYLINILEKTWSHITYTMETLHIIKKITQIQK